jgi:hypothetical protein
LFDGNQQQQGPRVLGRAQRVLQTNKQITETVDLTTTDSNPVRVRSPPIPRKKPAALVPTVEQVTEKENTCDLATMLDQATALEKKGLPRRALRLLLDAKDRYYDHLGPKEKLPLLTLIGTVADSCQLL